MKIAREKGLVYLYWSIGLAALAWTVVVGASAFWNGYNEREQTLNLARREARAIFNKDQAFRLWGAKHGGVYVPPTGETPPNPYLSHIPDRDITLPSGKRLTLMNPAYMLRQLMADYNELYGIKGRITSLKPLNPDNAPDPWERESLQAFEQGVEEVFVITGKGRERSLRLMRPMVTKAGCLKCHAQQGYKEGEIRGGVGVSVPLSPYLALEKKTTDVMALTHLGIWLLGLLTLGLIFPKGKGYILAQVRSLAALGASEVQLREAHERLLTVLNSLEAVVYVADLATYEVLFINKYVEEQFGDIVGQQCWRAIQLGQEGPCPFCSNRYLLDGAGQPGGVYHWEHFNERNGRWYDVRDRAIRWIDGRTVRLEIATDISKRKEIEEELRQLNSELEERVVARTAELANKNSELEKLNKLFVGRELTMIEP